MAKTRSAILSALLFLIIIPSAFSLPAEVVYTEGETYIHEYEGVDYEAVIGDEVNTGDSVKTGSDGYMELDRNDVTIKINPDTVFTLIPREEKSKKTDVFTLFLGSASFRYNVLTGKEPPVQTSSMVAGARGTEFTVLAGFDGSSMVVVKSGEVAVNSEGKTVNLKPQEGVQVNPGEPPGEKFRVLIGKVDYKKWNEDRFNSFIKDPVKAVERTENRMKFYIENISELYPVYLENRAKLDSERKKNKEIKHGKIKILFTPDEEIEKGADSISIDEIGADFGFTIDGGEIGSLEIENFNAASGKIFIKGNYAHEGYAYGKMINSLRYIPYILDLFPKSEAPLEALINISSGV